MSWLLRIIGCLNSAPLRWHFRAGGGAVHSINCGNRCKPAPLDAFHWASTRPPRRQLQIVLGPGFSDLQGDLEGITKAKAAGVYKGRPGKIDTVKVRELKAQGRGATEIAEEMGIARASVYRALEAGQ